jgi:hypothetical protein
MSLTKVRALAVVSLLLAAAIAMVYVTVHRDTQRTVTADPTSCHGDLVPVSIELPAPKDIKINVYNATDRVNLASSVSANLANRKFQVLKSTNDPLHRRIDGVAVLRYGPKTVGAAWLLRAYFLNDIAMESMEFDINRDDDVVDVVLGNSFRDLATFTEVNQSVAAEGDPELPKGTCLDQPKKA